MIPKVPPQFDPENIEARNRDIILRWVEGCNPEAVAKRYGIPPDAVLEIVHSAAGQKLVTEIRDRILEATAKRFDAATGKSLEKLVELRDESQDERMQHQASVDIIKFSSLGRKDAVQVDLGPELIRLVNRKVMEDGPSGKDS